MYYLDINACHKEKQGIRYSWILLVFSALTEAPKGMVSIFIYTNSFLQANKTVKLKSSVHVKVRSNHMHGTRKHYEDDNRSLNGCL